jgi:multiple sugar transport system substrate-binding protein
MSFRNFGNTPLSRRTLMRNAAMAGVSVMGLDLLAACSSSSGGTVTITADDLPPTSNPAQLRIYQNYVKSFQQLHSGIKVDARNDPYNPQTFLAKAAAHSQEDLVDTYFTEPSLLISKHVLADVTSQVKKLSYFNSFVPSAVTIASGTDGKIYGLPYSGYALGVMYSIKAVKKAGIDPSQPPKTWEDFRTYAAKIASTGTPGFVELTKDNTGGWHLTNWIYTAGGDLETVNNGKTTATFNNEKAVAWLKQLQAMKHTDKSMYSDVLVGYNDALQIFAAGKAGMVIEAADTLASLKSGYQADLTDIGLWPMPQNGGNAALSGGHIYVFKAGDSAEALDAAIQWASYYRFDLGVYEDSTAQASAAGLPVGYPANVLFQGDYQQQRMAIDKKYANLPLDNYAPFVSSTVGLRPEPPTQTQKLYAALDSVVQKVLTDPAADPQALLAQAQTQFQSVLDAS